jgi:mannose-6-phosphate isomerase-like protein (cupin superfamily)
MIPLVMRIKSKTLEEFGPYSRHPGEEYNYVLQGRVAVHTEFYETEILEEGDSVYIDASMGHAFLAAEGCDEAVVVEVCSSNDEDLMSSLMDAHGPGEVASEPRGADRMKVVRRS